MIGELANPTINSETIEAVEVPEVPAVEVADKENYPWDGLYYAEYVPVEAVQQLLAGWQNDHAQSAIVFLNTEFQMKAFEFVAEALLQYRDKLDLVMEPSPTFESLKAQLTGTELQQFENDFRNNLQGVVTEASKAMSTPAPKPEVESHL